MQRTDLDAPFLTIPLSSGSTSSRFVRLTCSGILIISCTIFGFTQCYAQDVAEAARQEKARKENQQKKPKHVYTDEDLKRAQILIPEDRAEVEAKRIPQPVPGTEAAPEPIDAQALPADLPLGDIARRYRKLREMLRLEQSAEFHLPFANEPVLATPKPAEADALEAPTDITPRHPVVPARPAIVIPAEPRIEPFQPPVKRSPFERPRIYLSVPSRSSVNRPTAPKAPAIDETHSQQPTILAAPAKPAAPAPDLSVMPSPRLMTPHAQAARPAAPILSNAPSPASVLSATPSKPATPKLDFSFMSAPRQTPHTTPAQPTVPIVGATPSHASGFLAIPSSPAAPTPDFSVMPSPKVAAHAIPVQPAPPVVEAKPLRPPMAAVTPAKPATAIAPAVPPKLNVVVVKPGGSLWKLAEENLGKGTRWRELLAVNPAIVDPDHIDAGSQIFLPSLASSFRTATRIIVRKGDTLSQIAQNQFGRASLWSCIAQANPSVHDPNLIYEGQSLLLPAHCNP
jgi:nucleoid-associated protein YgaU